MEGSGRTPVAEVSALTISTYSSFIYRLHHVALDLSPPVPPGPGQWMRSVQPPGIRGNRSFLAVCSIMSLPPLRVHLEARITGTLGGHEGSVPNHLKSNVRMKQARELFALTVLTKLRVHKGTVCRKVQLEKALTLIRKFFMVKNR